MRLYIYINSKQDTYIETSSDIGRTLAYQVKAGIKESHIGI